MAKRSSSAGSRDKRRAYIAQTLLIFGAVVLVAGGVLLLWTLGFLTLLDRLWPVPVMLAGMVLLYMAYLRGRSGRYIIPGMILTLGGLFFLLLLTVLQPQSLGKYWPAFMTISGLSLIPYAYRRKGASRTALVIPALFITALSLVFFLFSLGTAGITFREFVRQWWPLVLIALGLALIVSFFGSRRPSSKV